MCHDTMKARHKRRKKKKHGGMTKYKYAGQILSKEPRVRERPDAVVAFPPAIQLPCAATDQ